jgi:hypothetical protein
LLETTRAGITAESAETAAAILTQWLTAWKNTGTLPYSGVRDEIERYGQPRQAAALASLLDRAVDTRSSISRQSSARALR